MNDLEEVRAIDSSSVEHGPRDGPPPRDREALLCQWAIEEGFDRAGVARLDASEHSEEYRAWLARGDHGTMEYLARRIDTRLQPSSRLEGSRSALCVALHYPDRTGEENDLWSGVARYAQGDDYHAVMMRRLRRLGDRIEAAFPGCRSRSYVDTGPILERELGQRAGLGSIGKNTMLLHRTGSYFLLGEVLLTLDLEPAQTLPDLCGQCTRCLDACPTGALTAPYTLDARRCISFWTIEHRGEFPEAVSGALHGWTFGCDICQEVCPWNLPTNPRRTPPLAAQALALPAHRGSLDLVQLASLERSEYTERFRRSAMKRAKLEGLQRNAVAVLTEKVRGILQANVCEGTGKGGSDEVALPEEGSLEEVETALFGLLQAMHTEGTTVRRTGAESLVQLIPELDNEVFGDLRTTLAVRLEEWLARRGEESSAVPNGCQSGALPGTPRSRSDNEAT